MAAALAAGQTWLALGAATVAVAVATPAYPALAAAMPGLAGRHTERATSLLVTCEVASFVVGPALGGLLLAPATRDLVPWAAVLCLVAAWLLFEGVRLPAPVAVVAPTRATGVLAALRTSAVLRGAVAAVAVVNAVAASVGLALLPLAAVLGRRGARGRRSGSPPAPSASAPWADRCSGASATAGGLGPRVWLVVLAACLAGVAAGAVAVGRRAAAGGGRRGRGAGRDRGHRLRAGRGARTGCGRACSG